MSSLLLRIVLIAACAIPTVCPGAAWTSARGHGQLISTRRCSRPPAAMTRAANYRSSAMAASFGRSNSTLPVHITARNPLAGATHALLHGSTYLPVILLWPFTVFEFSRSIHIPYLVSGAAAAGFLLCMFVMLRRRRVPVIPAMATTGLLGLSGIAVSAWRRVVGMCVHRIRQWRKGWSGVPARGSRGAAHSCRSLLLRGGAIVLRTHVVAARVARRRHSVAAAGDRSTARAGIRGSAGHDVFCHAADRASRHLGCAPLPCPAVVESRDGRIGYSRIVVGGSGCAARRHGRLGDRRSGARSARKPFFRVRTWPATGGARRNDTRR